MRVFLLIVMFAMAAAAIAFSIGHHLGEAAREEVFEVVPPPDSINAIADDLCLDWIQAEGEPNSSSAAVLDAVLRAENLGMEPRHIHEALVVSCPPYREAVGGIPPEAWTQ